MSSPMASLVDFDDAARTLLPSLEQLEGLLEAEIAALTAGDPATLGEQVHRKRALLRELETRVGALQVPSQRAPRGATLWQQMLARLARCHELNQAIGATVTRQLRDNDQLLRMLGHAPDPVAYGPRGTGTAVAGPGRPLGLG
jgi:flagellar biosynthesis/type III secretory pathway chaperone